VVTFVETKQYWLKKLFKTVRTTRRISELVRQRVSDRRTSDPKTPDIWFQWTAYMKVESAHGLSSGHAPDDVT